ncbi:MAG: hypothetical protein JXQ73_22850 [Phycisphaerae bacterium]|nr:hypothetical protein [Phycisphaerae bacterium]
MSQERKHRIAVMLLIVAPLIATTFSSSTCMETTLLALNPCGTVLDCSPADWFSVVWPVVEAPNYDRDPSCTIPFLCGSPWGGLTGTTQ